MRPETFTDRAAGQIIRVGQGETTYHAFVPSPLPPAQVLDPELILTLSDADRALGELAGLGRAIANPGLLVRPFMQRGVFLELTPGGGYFAEDHAGQIKVELQKALRPRLEQQKDALTAEAYRQDTSKEDRGRAEAARKKYISALKRLSSKHSLDNLTDLMRTGRDSLARDNADFDRDPWALHCLNCRVDLRTGQEREGRHEDMDKIVLPRTGEPAVEFEGKRILFEAADVGCAHFEFHGYVAHSPVSCYVIALRERRRCQDTRDVAVFDDRASFEKGLAAAKGVLAAFQIAYTVASAGGDGIEQCATCPRGGK